MRNKEMGNKNTKGRWNFREFREENSTKLKLDLIKWNFVDKMKDNNYNLFGSFNIVWLF